MRPTKFLADRSAPNRLYLDNRSSAGSNRPRTASSRSARRTGRSELATGAESPCRIPSCRTDGLPRDLSMANEERKREKAVKKIEAAVRKAMGKGVSRKVIEDTVGQALVKTVDNVPAKKTAVKRSPATEAPAKKSAAEQAPATKAVAKKAPAKAVVKKAPAKKAV